MSSVKMDVLESKSQYISICLVIGFTFQRNKLTKNMEEISSRT